jgi:hypothetical protein
VTPAGGAGRRRWRPGVVAWALWGVAILGVATRAAGVAPPTTNPKYRPPAVATTPGSAAVASSATTSRGSSGRFQSGSFTAALLSRSGDGQGRAS